jgi:pimeloyl-ACP methyl ester carboxylesterase
MFVLVHGAWHGAWCWARLRESLTEAGALSTAVDLPGRAGDTTPLEALDLDVYADRVVAAIESIEEPVVLVGHSMGGATISQVAERVPDRLEGLVYLCALLQPSGASPADLHAHDPDSELMAAVELADDALSTSIRPDAAADLFYGDCSAEEAARAVAQLVAEPTGPATGTITTTAERWGSVPRAYVRCDLDRAVSPIEQDRMVAEVGVDVVVELPTSHSPFLSQPDLLAATLVDLRDGLT